MDRKLKVIDEQNQNNKDNYNKLLEWYIKLKSDVIKDLTLKTCIKNLKDAKNYSKKLYLKVFIEIIKREKSIFLNENFKENIEFFKDQIDYITDNENNVDKKDMEFTKNCSIFTFKLATEIKDFKELKQGNYLKKLLYLILICIPNLFNKNNLIDYNNSTLLIYVLNGVKKISKIYYSDNLYLLNYINEITILSCYKLFNNEKEITPHIIYKLSSLLKIQLNNYTNNYKDMKDLNFKNINLCLLYLLYTFSYTNSNLKSSEIIINKNKKNKLNDKENEQKLLFKVIEEYIIKSYLLNPKLIYNFLDIISGDFFTKISKEEKYTSNNYNNFLLSLHANKEKINLICSLYNKDITELNSFKEHFYSFILNENFGEKHMNIKEMILAGLISLYQVYPLQYCNHNSKIYIPNVLLFYRIKTVLKDGKSIFNLNLYPLLISFLLYLIKNYKHNFNDSWNDIIDILLFLTQNIDIKGNNNLNEIIQEMTKLLLMGNLKCDIKKYIELFNNINTDSIILRSIICNITMSIKNIDYYSKYFIQKYVFDNSEKKNNSLIQSNFCLLLDKIKYYIKYEHNSIKQKYEKILYEYLDNILNFSFDNKNLNEYISCFLIECILYMDYSDNFISLIEKLFNINKKKFDLDIILYDILWVLNYNFQKEKIEKYLDVLLKENIIEKNSKLKEKILINLIVTKDNLIHIKNYNQNLIKFKCSPIPILIANYDYNNEKSIFVLFDIKKIIKNIFDKFYNNRNNINIFNIILNNIENAITLNQESIYPIYMLFIDSQILLKQNFKLNEDKLLLKIFTNLNYYFPWSNKFFMGKKEEIELSSYFKEINYKKDILFQSIFHKMKNNICLQYFFPIYQFYFNTIYENNIDDINNYSNNPQIIEVLNYLSILYVNNKNITLILLNILYSYSFFQEIILNLNNNYILYQIILILCLIGFSDYENFFIDIFKTELKINLPVENNQKDNKIVYSDEIKENEIEILFIKNFAKNLLYIYLSAISVKEQLISIFKNFPNKNNNEFYYFVRMIKLEIELNIKKRNTCSSNKIKEIMLNKNSFGKYLIIEKTLLLAYPENDYKLTLIILNEFVNLQYLIEIPKSNSKNLSDQEQIKKFNKIINNINIEINENKTFSNTKYLNQQYYLLFNEENICKIILQYISDILFNNTFSNIENIKNINNENFDKIKNIIEIPIFNICNVIIIYNTFSFNSNLIKEELFDKNKDNFSNEFIEFLSYLGDLEIEKDNGNIYLFYEDYINRVNIFVYDSFSNIVNRNNIISKSQIQIIWMDYPNQSINEYLKLITGIYNKVYIFIFPITNNLYKISLRIRNDNTENKYSSLEENLIGFIEQYFLTDFMINIYSPSGIRYFRKFIILLNERINFLKEKLNTNSFLLKEEKINNEIIKLKKNIN